jgi:hypothetical protein
LDTNLSVNTDAGEWIIKEVEGKKVLVDAYPKVVERKPFLNKKQTVNTDAGQWDVKVVDGKRVFAILVFIFIWNYLELCKEVLAKFRKK